MSDNFIFDVDGTLTPSRQQINPKFKDWFIDFCDTHPVYLVTGSDYEKTVEQLGIEICMSVKRIYNCSGNDVWEQGINVRTNDWVLPEDAHEWLSVKLTESNFPLRTGLHFEHRPGTVNFSVVGRNATLGERKLYVKFDEDTDERIQIAEEFLRKFPDLDAKVGGETGIDIYPKGADKSQIIKDFTKYEWINFFGDRMDPAGNDYPLGSIIKYGMAYHVTGWEDTWERLNAYNANRP